MVVRPGETNRAKFTSSKPASRTSCGTRFPIALSEAIMSAATRSFPQTTASGRCFFTSAATDGTSLESPARTVPRTFASTMAA